jgi:hypothetical protein
MTRTICIGLALLAVTTCFVACADTPAGSAPHGPGLSCAAPADCMSGLTCATEDPNGQCIKLCTPKMDATCGDPLLACSFEGHCYLKCTTTTDCSRAAEGYSCKDDQPARGVKFCDKT